MACRRAHKSIPMPIWVGVHNILRICTSLLLSTWALFVRSFPLRLSEGFCEWMKMDEIRAELKRGTIRLGGGIMPCFN